MLNDPLGLVVNVEFLEPSKHEISEPRNIVPILHQNLVVLAVEDSSDFQK